MLEGGRDEYTARACDLHALVDVEATGDGKTHCEEHRGALVGGVKVDAARDWSCQLVVLD